MLPHFLRHYDQLDCSYLIYLNEATIDRSAQILKAHPKVEIVPLDTGGLLRDDIHAELKNSGWKRYRDQLDWVIVVDTDELLFHPGGLKDYLGTAKAQRVTLPPVEGFNMFAEDYPNNHSPITEQVKQGVRSHSYAKRAVFDPKGIVEINYKPGAHNCSPEGNIREDADSPLKLLHYKYIGELSRLRRRWEIDGAGLSPENIEFKWALGRLDPGQVVRTYRSLRRHARPVI